MQTIWFDMRVIFSVLLCLFISSSNKEFFEQIFIMNFITNRKKKGKNCILRGVVFVTIWYPTFCLAFYLTGVLFRDESQHVGQVVSKSVEQSKLEKQLVSDCKTNYMLNTIKFDKLKFRPKVNASELSNTGQNIKAKPHNRDVSYT